MERQRLPKRPMPFRFCCKCSDVNAPNDYMRSNAGHNHLKINKGGGTLYKENVPRRTVFNLSSQKPNPRCAAGVQPA